MQCTYLHSPSLKKWKIQIYSLSLRMRACNILRRRNKCNYRRSSFRVTDFMSALPLYSSKAQFTGPEEQKKRQKMVSLWQEKWQIWHKKCHSRIIKPRLAIKRPKKHLKRIKKLFTRAPGHRWGSFEAPSIIMTRLYFLLDLFIAIEINNGAHLKKLRNLGFIIIISHDTRSVSRENSNNAKNALLPLPHSPFWRDIC